MGVRLECFYDCPIKPDLCAREMKHSYLFIFQSPNTLSKCVLERSSLEGGGSSSRQADTGRVSAMLLH